MVKIGKAVYVMGGGQTVLVFYDFLNFLAGGVIKIGNILVVVITKPLQAHQKKVQGFF